MVFLRKQLDSSHLHRHIRHGHPYSRSPDSEQRTTQLSRDPEHTQLNDSPDPDGGFNSQIQRIVDMRHQERILNYQGEMQ